MVVAEYSTTVLARIRSHGRTSGAPAEEVKVQEMAGMGQDEELCPNAVS